MEPTSTERVLPSGATPPSVLVGGDPLGANVPTPQPVYRCPGEPDPISVGVHFSRLASFYHKCRHCEHRLDVGRLAPAVQRRWDELLKAPDPPRLFTVNGVRGLTLNQLTRSEATQVAMAYAATLREVLEVWRSRSPVSAHRWMKVVFGYDGRPQSPELAMAAASTLRQHGCELIDIGWSTRSQTDVALKQYHADGAFFVTGHGAPVGWNGFDLIGPDGVVWSREGVLDLVEQRFHQNCPRLDREAAPQTLLDMTDVSIPVLRKQLHGFRPWRVAVKTRDIIVRRILSAVQADWPGELILEPPINAALAEKITQAEKTTHTGKTSLTEEIARTEDKPSQAKQNAAASRIDILFELGEDGRQLAVFDESGHPVSNERILFGLGELLLDEHPHVDVVLSDTLFDRCGWTVERCGPGYLVFHRGGPSEEQLVRTMGAMNSPLAVDGEGRFWLRLDGTVRCDGLLTLALIMRSLGRTDRTVSEWAKTEVAS